MQTITALNNGLRHAISCGLVSNRSDVIRQLCKGGFEIVRVTNDDVTICIPDEPEELLTLTGYIYTHDFEIQPAMLDGRREKRKRCPSAPGERRI
ncbi:hypothetical protein ACO4CX_004651 [Escherichia coli]